MVQVAKVPRIETSPELLRYFQILATRTSGVGFPLSKKLVVPDVNLRNANETAAVGQWPAANRAIYVPFSISTNVTVDTIGAVCVNAGGNVDYGIYSELGVALFRNGGHAATANTFDSVSVGGLALSSGFYYIGIAADGVVVQLSRLIESAMGGSVYAITGVGVLQQASAYPLPATATFASPTSAYIPVASLGVSRVSD